MRPDLSLQSAPAGLVAPGIRPLPLAEVLLAAPRGFCAGVRRAIDAVRDALAVHGAPVYVRHAIVHNEAVVRELEREGAVFVEELDEIPAGGVVIFSAHGVSPGLAREAARRGLRPYDAVCPLVAKVHREVERHHRAGRHVVVIGHAGHAEIVGTLGHLPTDAASLVGSPDDVRALPQAACTPLAYAVQTTFCVGEAAAIVAALEERFADLAGPRTGDICYATTNRQAALHNIAAHVEAVIVAGSRSSSNANRLADIARASCRAVQLIGSVEEIDWDLLPERGGRIGLTAAASTPEQSVAEILRALGQRYRLVLSEVRSASEAVQFRRVEIGG